MAFDSVPLPLVLLATLALVLLALHIGASLGVRRVAQGKGKLEVAGPMVGATMGLLAFMLAFTFNAAAARHEARKALVIKEANAIETTWLRAGFLAEPSRTAMRDLLKEYVGWRVKVALYQVDLAEGLHQSEHLQERMWTLATENGRREPSSVVLGLFTASLNEAIDLHLERLTVSIRTRVPMPTWATLYVLMVIGMGMVGLQIGGSGRHFGLELALAVSFSVVLLMIADLDRPQQGLVTVSQQAMSELQAKLQAR
jgi:hypothetical protein